MPGFMRIPVPQFLDVCRRKGGDGFMRDIQRQPDRIPARLERVGFRDPLRAGLSGSQEKGQQGRAAELERGRSG